MAISTQLSGERREGQVSLGYQNKMLVVNETYHYFVHVTLSGGSTVDDVDRRTILNTDGLPIPYLTISPSGLGICKGTTCDRDPKAPLLWRVTATFSSEVENSQSGTPGTQVGTNPETWVPLRETYIEYVQEALMQAVNGKPFANGAGAPYASSPMRNKALVRWEFAQFEPASVTDEEIADRNEVINSVPFKGYGNHQLLLKVRKSVIGTYYGALRRLTEYSITLNKDNWHTKLPNVGTTFKYNGKIYEYRYPKAPTTTVTGPLGSRNIDWDEDYTAADGLPSGGVDTTTMPGEVLAVETDPITIYWIERKIYEAVNFSTFLRI